MPRAIWKGTISFGLVTIPVGSVLGGRTARARVPPARLARPVARAQQARERGDRRGGALGGGRQGLPARGRPLGHDGRRGLLGGEREGDPDDRRARRGLRERRRARVLRHAVLPRARSHRAPRRTRCCARRFARRGASRSGRSSSARGSGCARSCPKATRSCSRCCATPTSCARPTGSTCPAATWLRSA